MRYVLSVIYQFFEENYFSNTMDGQYEYLDFSGTNTTLLLLVGGLCIGVLIASVMIYYQKTVVGAFVRRLLTEKIFSAKEGKTLSELDADKSGAVKREMTSRSSVLRKLVSYEEDGVVYDYKSDLARRFSVGSPEEGESAEAKTETEKKTEEDAAENGGEAVTEAVGEDTAAPEKPKRKGRAFFRRLLGRDTLPAPRKPDFEKARFFIPEDLSYRAELHFGKKGMSVRSLVITFLCVLLCFFVSLRLIPIFVSMLDTTIGNVIGGI